jgi:hypothetical protein
MLPVETPVMLADARDGLCTEYVQVVALCCKLRTVCCAMGHGSDVNRSWVGGPWYSANGNSLSEYTTRLLGCCPAV